jgi:peptide/nickel transport system substrate-binding protein
MDWKNQAFEDQLKIAETTLGPAEQKAAWADMQRIYAEDLPALPLFFVPQAHVIPTWLKGYVPSGMTDYTTLRAEDWHAE